jgi:hypothetical protein
MYFLKVSNEVKIYSKNWKIIALSGISIAQYHFDISGQSLSSPFLPGIMQTDKLLRWQE